MKCDEVQLLQGPFLDSELDARTTLEIGEHLKSCAQCARLFAEGQKLEARMKAGLNRGQRTAALWAELERAVTAASRPTEVGRAGQTGGWQSILGALAAQVQASLQPSRRAWAGLAAVWVVIVGLNFSAREAEEARVAEKQLPGSSEVRFAVNQKRLLMADLAAATEPAPAEKGRMAPPSPRSDRRRETLNI